jgi:4a-hydroxytetrahydrobiopterin dehydratase
VYPGNLVATNSALSSLTAHIALKTYASALNWNLAVKLNESDIQTALTNLPGWSFVGEKLHREYRFADFTLAFGFMAASATVIEKMNHHPEWTNVYSSVVVELTTHDAGGVTSKDLELAEALENLAQRLL